MILRKAVSLSLIAALSGAPLAGCLAREAGVTDAMNVNVNTYRGVVQLAGFVDSKELVQRAERIAQGVEGVKSVKNDLRVSP